MRALSTKSVVGDVATAVFVRAPWHVEANRRITRVLTETCAAAPQTLRQIPHWDRFTTNPQHGATTQLMLFFTPRRDPERGSHATRPYVRNAVAADTVGTSASRLVAAARQATAECRPRRWLRSRSLQRNGGCLSVCLSACLSVCLPACLSVYLPACLSVCLQ